MPFNFGHIFDYKGHYKCFFIDIIKKVCIIFIKDINTALLIIIIWRVILNETYH